MRNAKKYPYTLIILGATLLIGIIFAIALKSTTPLKTDFYELDQKARLGELEIVVTDSVQTNKTASFKVRSINKGKESSIVSADQFSLQTESKESAELNTDGLRPQFPSKLTGNSILEPGDTLEGWITFNVSYSSIYWIQFGSTGEESGIVIFKIVNE